MTSLRVLIVAATALLLAGCPSDPGEQDPDTGGDVGVDSGADAGTDSGDDSDTGTGMDTGEEPSCEDGLMNGDETDVDCGGSCDACPTDANCGGDEDCQGGFCDEGVCAAPSCGDGVVNQDDEVCDEGDANGPDSACNADCSERLCVLGEDVDTLQEALDDGSCPGVWIPDGEYEASVTIDRPFRIVGESPDAIVSPDGLLSRIIDTDADSLELRNLTLTNGRAATGGAVQASRDVSAEAGSLLITNVTFTDNLAAEEGGALWVQRYDVEMSSTTFTANGVEASDESGVGGAMSMRYGTFTATDSLFEENSVTATEGPTFVAVGGAVVLITTVTEFFDVDFRGNYVSASGAPSASPVVFAIGGAVTASGGDLTVEGGEVRGNEAAAESTGLSTMVRGDGGAFYFTEDAAGTLTDVTVQDNQVFCDSATTVRCRGGGVSVQKASVRLSGMQLLENEVSVAGDTHETDDFVVGGGGGLFVESGSAIVSESTVSRNSVLADIDEDGIVWGGGLLAGGGPPTSSSLIVKRSTIDDNHISISAGNLSLAAGGGIGVNARRLEASAYVVNSTISSNSASATDGVTSFGVGGGIGLDKVGSVNGVELQLRSSTVVANEATHTGGALSTGGATGGITATVTNTILLDNVAPTVSTCHSDVLQSLGFNLLEADADCPRTGDTADDVIDATATVGPLQDNGGPTFTHAIEAGSPAADGGDPAGCLNEMGMTLIVDQRLMDRDDGQCDIGSFELQ